MQVGSRSSPSWPLPVTGQQTILRAVPWLQSPLTGSLYFRSNNGESGRPGGSRSASSGGGNRRRRGGWRSWRDGGRRKRSAGGRRRTRGESTGSRWVCRGRSGRDRGGWHRAELGEPGQKACTRVHTCSGL